MSPSSLTYFLHLLTILFLGFIPVALLAPSQSPLQDSSLLSTLLQLECPGLSSWSSFPYTFISSVILPSLFSLNTNYVFVFKYKYLQPNTSILILKCVLMLIWPIVIWCLTDISNLYVQNKPSDLPPRIYFTYRLPPSKLVANSVQLPIIQFIRK